MKVSNFEDICMLRLRLGGVQKTFGPIEHQLIVNPPSPYFLVSKEAIPHIVFRKNFK